MAVELIISAGHQIDPLAVEQRLLEHPAVLDALAVGRPDALRGEIVKAFILLRKANRGNERMETELVRFVQKRLPLHAVPREIEFIELIPRNPAGEVERGLLRAGLRKGAL
jgi:acetyl-CoA synthetase